MYLLGVCHDLAPTTRQTERRVHVSSSLNRWALKVISIARSCGCLDRVLNLKRRGRTLNFLDTCLRNLVSTNQVAGMLLAGVRV